jgi:hypothetical protein
MADNSSRISSHWKIGNGVAPRGDLIGEHLAFQKADQAMTDMLHCDVHKGRSIASLHATKCNGLAALILLCCARQLASHRSGVHEQAR